MEWLWLLLLVAGLGVIWLAIWGLEQLSHRMKMRDDEMRDAEEELQKRIDREESDFLRVQNAKDYIENAEVKNTPGQVDTDLNEAMSILSTEELFDSLVKRAYGNQPQSNDSITASRSVFAEEPKKVAVANGDGIVPVKAKPSSKSALSRSEQKMLKKIKKES